MDVPSREGDGENRTRTLGPLSHPSRRSVLEFPPRWSTVATTIIDIETLPADSWVGRWEVGPSPHYGENFKQYHRQTVAVALNEDIRGSPDRVGCNAWHGIRMPKAWASQDCQGFISSWQARLAVKILVIWKNPWKSLGSPRLPVPPSLQCVAQAILACKSVKQSSSRINFNSF